MINFFLNQFKDYANEIARSSNGVKGAMELKREHSIRVLEEARLITRALGIDPESAFPLHLAALFHDIGRFTQMKEFGTFSDSQSVNHALESVYTLRSLKILEDLALEKRRLIFGAIFLHNYAVLPICLKPALSLAARVLRDADKLDIVQLILTAFEGRNDLDSGIYLGLEPDPVKYSQKIAASAMEAKVLRLEHAKYVNDYLIFLSSWVYDLNFDFTREQFRQRDYIDRIFGKLPQDDTMLSLKKRIEKRIL